MALLHRAVPPRQPSARAPLLVLAHGLGTDEEDLLPLLPHLDPRFLALSVRAPDPVPPAGYGWYAIDWSTQPPRVDLAGAARSRDQLAAFVEQAAAGPAVDRERVFLLGFSQGAVLGLAVALARPDLVRGVVAHSGRFLAGLLTGGWRCCCSTARRTRSSRWRAAGPAARPWSPGWGPASPTVNGPAWATASPRRAWARRPAGWRRGSADRGPRPAGGMARAGLVH
jgi:pimeloyl-ACP methyl ester carboxylesterase